MKSQNLPIETMIIIIIALVVLIFIVIYFFGYGSVLSHNTSTVVTAVSNQTNSTAGAIYNLSNLT